jgi:hypothetical protein
MRIPFLRYDRSDAVGFTLDRSDSRSFGERYGRVRFP